MFDVIVVCIFYVRNGNFNRCRDLVLYEGWRMRVASGNVSKKKKRKKQETQIKALSLLYSYRHYQEPEILHFKRAILYIETPPVGHQN